MPNAVMFAITALALVSLVAAFAIRWRDANFKRGEALSDALLRVAYVCFGVMFAVISFFSQKWSEDINARIDQANESISNINVIQARFASQIESTYYNNDGVFHGLTRACAKIAAKDVKAATYCERPAADGEGLTVQNVLDGSDYFDVDPPADFYPDFFSDLEKQSFVKQSFAADTFKDMFDLYARIVEKSNIVRNYAKDFAAKHDKIQDSLAKLSPALKLDHGTNAEALTFAHDMCCTVKNISDFSDQLAALASKQMQQFCSVRKRIGEALQDQISGYYRPLVSARLEAIQGRIAFANQSCTFTPRPIDNE